MKEVGNRGIGRKPVSGLMAQRQWRMITRGLLGQAAGMRQRKRRDLQWSGGKLIESLTLKVEHYL